MFPLAILALVQGLGACVDVGTVGVVDWVVDEFVEEHDDVV